MIIKQTPWEKRNLGVDSSVEYIISSTDQWNEIVEDLKCHAEAYQVMHIPSGNTNVLVNASTLGFFPIEMNFQLSKKLGTVDLPSIYRRFENVITCNIATDTEKEQIIESIRSGDIFSTDKVARDPYFGNRLAGQRYAYWTLDVLNQGADLLSMKYKGKLAAFDVCVDKGNDVAEAFLGGTFLEFRNSGLGFLPVYLITKYAKEKGYKKIITGVSSNNITILKIHEMFGYTIDSATYCMIKHSDRVCK